MPAINLPSISISDKDFRSQDTMNQILDTLQKYRKELNFLLMNLDEENMPVIDEKMDGLYGRMETVDGQVSEFIQTVDGFRMTVSNYEGQVSEFIQTVDGFQTTVSNYEGQVSQFVQTVDGFQTTVANYQGQVSQFTQTVDGFQSQVSNYASEVGTFNSTITQLATEVSSIVSFTDVTGNEIASRINQTATTISISASKIDLTGITTIYGNEGYTRMGGTGLSIVSPFGNTFRINWDSYIAYELGSGVTTIFPDVVWFEGPVWFTSGSEVVFNGDVDFSYANVTGLDIGGGPIGDEIRAYWASNRFWADFNGTDSITIRGLDGLVKGYINLSSS